MQNPLKVDKGDRTPDGLARNTRGTVNLVNFAQGKNRISAFCLLDSGALQRSLLRLALRLR